MDSSDQLRCPVPGCSTAGTVSQVAHHISQRDDEAHAWEALGFQHSYEFRRRHERDAGSVDDARSEDDSTDSGTASGESAALESVPGIGSTRASVLRRHGYTGASDVAEASVAELGAVPELSEATANCIRVTARETCAYPETVLSELASSLGVERSAVADAYGDLAACVVEPADAEPSLRLCFDGDDKSVMSLSEYAVRFRHFLRKTGFERVEDVAAASIEGLTEAPYVGTSRARNIRETARTRVQDADLGSDEPTSREDATAPAANGAETRRPEEGGEPDDRPDEAAIADHPANDQAAISPPGAFPSAMRERAQWLLWKPTDDGRKVPRAPWSTGDPLQFVDGTDPANWTSFGEAVDWMEKLPQDLRLAFCLTRADGFVFLDLDDVVDGTPSDEAQALIDDAESYAALSTSGTGVHVFGRGELSAGVKSLTGPLDDAGDQTLEVYDRNRFVAMTGDHVEDTPRDLTSISSLLADLEDEYGVVSSATPDRATTEPRRSREALRELESTSDIQDVFDAINQAQPADIRMLSTQTRDHGDGTYSYDPSWTHSESGTRLGVLEDVWIYREGMIALNALQVVALEEGIITDERDYPEGEAFWDAVSALRDRGAHVPRFEPDESTADYPDEDAPADIDEREVAKRVNYGDPVRTHVHRSDRDYQERLALDLAPALAESARSLALSATVAYRAAEVYAAGHAAGVVPGASHESTLGAALRVASIEAGTPRPLADIADSVGESPSSIRQKFHRLLQETGVADAIDASDLVVDPVEYVPYLARNLALEDDEDVREAVRGLLEDAALDGGSNPMSAVAGAFYVVLKQSPGRDVTQRAVADAAGVSVVTVRNNYRTFTDGPE